MKYGSELGFALWLLALGLLFIIFPKWWYKKVSPEQMARDRRRIKVFGYCLTALGVVASLLVILWL